MKIHVQKLSQSEWGIFSENAHKIAFGKLKPVAMERIDYALIATTDTEELIGYVTVKEMDSDTVYWQFGGGFPPGVRTIRIWHGYMGFLDWTRARYKRMTTLIENTNVPMLKLAMHAGLRVIGIRNYKGEVLLEHGIEF